MPINPSDFRFAAIKEVTAGTTPATPTFLKFPHVDGTEPLLTSNTVASPVVVANRASRGQRKTEYSVTGGLASQLQRSSVFDLFFESALSGAWVTNTLKAGNTDTNLTIEKTMYNGATPYFHRFVGCQVAGMNLNVSTGGVADISYDIIGMDRSTATTAIASSNYTDVSSTLPLVGLDLTATVAGFTADCYSVQLSVTHDREAQQKLGSAFARGIGTSGSRVVKATMQFYRDDLSADTLFAKSDAPVAVSFNIGSGLNGYGFSLPAANVNVPQDSTDASKALVTIEFTAGWDSTSATDFIITKTT